MTFNKQIYLELKKIYIENSERKIESFQFYGHELLTEYAKYLLQYLKPNFEK